jgi:hypothetical protein
MLIKGELRFIEILREMERFNPDKLDGIEEALLRGERYEEMWGDIERLFSAHAESNLKHIKQKYFPKPKEINWKERFNELEEEFEEREAELIKEIEYWKFRNYSGREHKI